MAVVGWGGVKACFSARGRAGRTMAGWWSDMGWAVPSGAAAVPPLAGTGAPVVKEISSNAEWVCNKFFKLVAATA